MAVSGKYGQVDIPGIGKDEPVFILRAQDRLAAYAVEMYGALAASHEAPVALEVRREAERLNRWTGPKKLPD